MAHKWALAVVKTTTLAAAVASKAIAAASCCNHWRLHRSKAHKHTVCVRPMRHVTHKQDIQGLQTLPWHKHC